MSTQYAATKYMLPILEKACREIQIKNLLPENIWTAYVSSMEWGDEELHEGCQDFLRKNVRDVTNALKSPTFLTLQHKVLLDILRLNDVEDDDESGFPEIDARGVLIAEIELFKACDAWAEAECKRQKLEVSGANKRVVLGDCLPLIRFPTMYGHDLAQYVYPSGILTHDEQYRLMEYIHIRHRPESKNETGFLSSNEFFLIKVKRDTEDTKPSTPGTCRSEIHLKPKDDLELERIWIRGEACQCTDLLFRLKPESGKTLLVSLDICTQEEIMEDSGGPLLHCALNNIYLQAGCRYQIRVVHKVRSGGHFHEHTPPPYKRRTFFDDDDEEDSETDLNVQTKDPDMVNLYIDEILQDATNECISALTARLV